MRRSPSRSSEATTAALTAAQRATCSSVARSAVGGPPRSRVDPQQGVLGHLAPARRPLPGRERGERGGVAQDGGRLPEGADQVLALGQVDPGLAADGRVDLGQERGGHVHVGRAAVERGGGEPGEVGHHPAPHGHHHVGPAESRPGEATAQLLQVRERLGRLAVGDGHHLEGDAGIDLDPDPLLGHHHGPAGRRHRRRDHPGELVADPVADQHLVGAVGQVDRHHCGHGRLRANAVAARMRSTTVAGSRSSTSTTTSATSS